MTVSFQHVTRNVRSEDRSVNGALVRLSPDGLMATVLLSADGSLVRVPADTLTPWRGRPIKLVNGLCRADVDELIATSDAFVVDAIGELFGRQLDSERESLATYDDNDVGFRADDARRGSLLALKASCGWTPEDYATARILASRYSGTQLYGIASEFLAEREIVEATTPRTELEMLLDSIFDGTFAI